MLADRLTDTNARAEYRGSRVSTKLKVMGVDLAVMGDKDAGAGDEVVHYSEPSRGVYKKMVVRDGRLAGAILLGDPDGAPTLQQAFDRVGAAARQSRRAAVSVDARRCAAVGGGPVRRRADLQLQRRHQGHADGGDRRRMPQPARALRRHARRHRLRLLQAAGPAGARGVRRRRRRRRSGGALLRARRAAAQARARRRDPQPEPAKRLGGLRGARRRPRGPEEQGRPGLAAEDDLGRRLRGRARRPVHQRSRPRQHPARRHLQRHPAHLRRRHVGGAAAAHRRRRRQAPGADGEDHRRPAHRPARHPEGQAPRGLARSRHAVRPRLRQGVPHVQDVRRYRVLPLRRRRQHRRSASPSRSGSRGWNRRTR